MPDRTSRARSHAATRVLAAVGAGALALWGWEIYNDLFGSALPYTMRDTLRDPLDSPEFVRFLSLVTDGTLRHGRITRLKNGAEFYPAQLEAIRKAKNAVNLETYEFFEGEIGSQFLDVMTERARAGVRVRLVVDWIGSMGTKDSYFDGLRAAGGEMRWYHPLRSGDLHRLNNRTHRKLLTVDGTTGFIGGAGIGDRWIEATKTGPAWRDTFLQVEGSAAIGLLSTFSENWLESSGEILSGQSEFGFPEQDDDGDGSQSFVVNSTPHGGGTQARILFQALLMSARHSIRITSPYFLPDRSARRALEDAARRRGVKIEILTAGPHIDHQFVRKLSHHSSRRLLEAGAKVYEYQPAMIHSKLMTIDGQWTVAGSTNFDHRSFALNDEVNIAVLDRDLAGTIEADFEEDLKQSRPLSLDELPKHTLLYGVEDVIEHAAEQES